MLTILYGGDSKNCQMSHTLHNTKLVPKYRLFLEIFFSSGDFLSRIWFSVKFWSIWDKGAELHMNDHRKAQIMSFEGQMDALYPETLAILERLVGFDTVSHKSNLALISYIEEILDKHSVPYTLIPAEGQEKAALYCQIGPPGDGGIGLSGHTDVVPVEGQSWTSDPFTLTRRGSRLYGRGTTDMKGYLALMLAAVPLFKAAPLARPLSLFFSYDEEIGCTGVRPMISKLGNGLPKPDLVVVGEPSTSRLVSAHKGITSFETIVTGLEAHSSVLHRGVSAIEVAVKLIHFLIKQQDALKSHGLDDQFDPPYSTVHVGEIVGGTARNIVAKSCQFHWEVRSLPGFEGASVARALAQFAEDELLRDMQRLSPETGIVTRQLGEVPGFAADSKAIEIGLKLARQNAAEAVSYGTEAGLFELGGVPAVICGPGHIHQAHKPDEFIEESELMKAGRVIEEIAATLCAS